MLRVEPTFPDLLPVSFRLGSLPQRPGTALDPVEMRLVRGWAPDRQAWRDRGVPRRPVRLLVHAATALAEGERLRALLAAGCGAIVVLDDDLAPEALPRPVFPAQLVALAPWLPPLWGELPLPDLARWSAAGITAGVLLALGPMSDHATRLGEAAAAAARAGARFAVAAPLAIPAVERHRVYDQHGGEAGDRTLEDLLFHSDHGRVALELERAASHACAAVHVAEGLPGPATAAAPAATVAAASRLLLWARRLDLLDGVSSSGWQLRRAAHALLASGRDPATLLAEDNLRVVPGFNPWVEAFARSLWAGTGEPWEEARARWMGE